MSELTNFPDISAQRIVEDRPIGLRWVIRPKAGGYDGHGPEHVLQYARNWSDGRKGGIEWVDVPTVDLTKEPYDR
jgi:hypothetical protein